MRDIKLYVFKDVKQLHSNRQHISIINVINPLLVWTIFNVLQADVGWKCIYYSKCFGIFLKGKHCSLRFHWVPAWHPWAFWEIQDGVQDGRQKLSNYYNKSILQLVKYHLAWVDQYILSKYVKFAVRVRIKWLTSLSVEDCLRIRIYGYWE